ncbi:MAG TPA: protein kinase [Bryobacteraceae bacterium]|nr:protein kinase [Bryobacteraceae bacterium]
METPLPFTRLSHYRILSRLGVGGMGEVYLAEDSRLDRRVAIKVLPAAYTADADRLRRFMLEAKASSALNHPHIVTVHDIGDSEAGRYLVMEAIEGRTLRSILAEGLPLGELAGLGAQMAKGLAAAHAAGIVHRDIKPENIMVRHDGYVKILDFGLARLQQASFAAPGSSTEPGVFMGTLKYMSPEQTRGEVTTAASDIYSLGMVFFELATGRYPFVAQSFLGVLNAIANAPAVAPSSLHAAVPPELDALILRMLDKDAGRRPSAQDVAAFLAPERSGTLTGIPVAPMKAGPVRHTVGRKRELQDLRAALVAVGTGRGMLLCVSGEPGIGKSTLVEEFLTSVAADGVYTIARGRCSERLAGTEAYLPVFGALENLLQAGTHPGISELMKQTAPDWYAQIANATSSGANAAISQDRLKRELGSLLQEASRQRPILLFFDDLHWADLSTVDLLTYLASQFSGMRLLIVVTYRPSDMLLANHPFLAVKPDLQARGLLRELPLSFLGEPEIAQYLSLEFPGHRFPAGFPRLIQAKTEGSPLFMADLVRYLRDKSVIETESGAWTLARGLPDIERDLPESVRGMIERKITQLQEEDRKLLSAASVQGYEFDSAVLVRVLGSDPDWVEERLETLDRVYSFVKLVREATFPNQELTLRYRFVHVLYQNALFGDLRATRRATLSREVAQALEAFHGAKSSSAANELAVLWESARDFGKAAGYFALAARQAGKVFADSECAVLAQRGLAALAQCAETPERTDQELALLVVLGVAQRAVKGFSHPDVGATFSRARELCPAAGHSARMVPVLRGLWEYYEVQADYEKAMPYARQLLELTGHLGDPGLMAVACDVMGDTSVWMGEFALAWEHLGRGTTLYDAKLHHSHVFLYGYDTGMACFSYGAIALFHLGYRDQAAVHMQRASAIAAELGHPMTTAFAAIMGAWLYRLMGDFGLALREGELAVQVSTDHELPFFLGFGQITRGWALVGLGRVQEGIADIEQGLAVYRTTGSELGNSLWLGCLAEGYAAAGRTDEARKTLGDAIRFMRRTGERVHEGELLRMQMALGVTV